jgi:hypothetical protein
MSVTRWSILGLAATPFLLSLLRPAPVPTLSWWTTYALEKIHPADPEPQNAEHAARIHAGRNEFEPFQVVLRAEGQDFDGIDIEVTDLRSQTGVVSSRTSVSVYMERYLDLKTASSVMGGTGEWPDPLIPRIDRYVNEQRNAFPFRLSAGRSQPIWIEVYIPPQTPAGMYHGQVRVSVSGQLYVAIPVELEVWNFELPSTSSLPTAFGFSGKAAIHAHYGKYTNDNDVYALTDVYSRAALWHRVTLNATAAVAPVIHVVNGKVSADWDAYDRVLGPFMDGVAFSPAQPLYGAKATSAALMTPPVLKARDEQVEFWRQAASHFREKGWFDRLFDYVWDEPGTKDFASVAEVGRLVHAADPQLKNLVTAPLRPAWSDFIDVWSPSINCFERKPHHSDFCDPMAERSAYDSELSKGKQLWWYQACGSHGCNIVGGDYFRGWPDYMIDDAPVRNRIMEWLTWKYGIQGELYFSTNEAFIRKPDPWKDVNLFGGNGDGTLFYPGRPDVIGGKTHIPIESIRLKLIREGLEDYEYLAMLTKLAGYQTVADHVNAFIHKTYDFNQDPRPLYATREWIGREISRLSSH